MRWQQHKKLFRADLTGWKDSHFKLPKQMTKDITIQSVVCGRRIFAIGDTVTNHHITIKIKDIQELKGIGFRFTDGVGNFLFLDTLIKKVK